MKKAVVFIMMFVLIAAIWFLLQNNVSSQASAIGIIGGADGPTTIFVAKKIGVENPFISIFLGILLVVVLIKRRGR